MEVPGHWIMVHVNLSARKMNVYDPCPGSIGDKKTWDRRLKILEPLQQMFPHMLVWNGYYKDKQNRNPLKLKWALCEVKNRTIPRQHDRYGILTTCSLCKNEVYLIFHFPTCSYSCGAYVAFYMLRLVYDSMIPNDLGGGGEQQDLMIRELMAQTILNAAKASKG